MWLFRGFWKLWGFGTAYIKNFHDAGFDLFHAIRMTKSQLGRFYWVNLIICAFVLYYLFSEAEQLRQANTLEHAECYPNQSLPALACLILAEIASFVLLLGAQAEAWVLYELRKSPPDHPILPSGCSRAAAARQLHRLLWTWFPLVVGVAVKLSTSRLDAVASWCIELPEGQYSGIRHGAKLALALVWPGLTISFLVVAAVSWVFYRWKPNQNLITTLAFAFVLYVVAIIIVGPSDIFKVVKLCREIRWENLESVFKSVTG